MYIKLKFVYSSDTGMMGLVRGTTPRDRKSSLWFVEKIMGAECRSLTVGEGGGRLLERGLGCCTA